MSSNRCRLMEDHDKRDLIEINQLIDLTDKPIGMSRDDIGWSKVKSNASNCICCCFNNSITLVTTDDSYILDHVPLDNIQFAQANASLQYLALSNHRKLAIIDLVDNNIKCGCLNHVSNSVANGSQSSSTNTLTSETKVVNLQAHGLTMSDVIFWKWIDNSNLAILSYEALYTCSINQQHINHPAYTAFSYRSRQLNMQRVFELHQNISSLCQVYDIQRDLTENYYAISSLYSTSNLLRLSSASNTHQHVQHAYSPTSSNTNILTTTTSVPTSTSGGLRSNFGSMPSRLSQLVNYEYSLDSLRSEHTSEHRHRHINSHSVGEDEVCGLVQIYCKMRDRSQLIQVHTATFTNSIPLTSPNQEHNLSLTTDGYQKSIGPTILVAANKIANRMQVHFIEMASYEHYPSQIRNASPTTKFMRLSTIDFPSSIVCSHISSANNVSNLHVALITTKHGQLYVCSVAHSTILFDITISNDIISSANLEINTQGLIVICRNGKVLLVQLKLSKLMKLLDESRTLRHISSTSNIQLSSMDMVNNNIASAGKKPNKISEDACVLEDQARLSGSLDNGFDVIISTKL